MRKTRLIVIVAVALVVLFGVVNFYLASELPPSAPANIVNTAGGTASVQGTESAIVPVTPTTPVNTTPLPSMVSGVVTDGTSPMPGATVQIQGQPQKILTDDKGAFTFNGISGTTPIILTAWATGHYVGWTTVDPSATDYKGGTGLEITLQSLPVKDNFKYDWFEAEGVKGAASCGLCHREYKEWQADAHSKSATNPHFLTMYSGTNMSGQESQPIRFDSKGMALPPDPSLPYFGPGFRLDTPDRAGNCATCHTPMASKVSNQQNCAWSGCHTSLTIEHSNGIIDHATIPLNLHAEAAEGINCEFCHKIGEVYIDPKTRLPYPDMPGILSMKLYRPADDSQQVFFGTLVDVTRHDSYLPLLSKSEFCAGCHYGVFGGVVGMGEVKDGTVIYNSYGEWLNSPYSDPKTGLTCQQCHMAPAKENWFVFAERGGLKRDYLPLHDHAMVGGSTDVNALQNAVTMKSTAKQTSDQVQVQVSITNDKTGHNVPTDAPTRSVILVVEALGADGKPLALRQGPVNPAYSGNYGGQPGKTFAKVLKDQWTGEAPTAAFWRPVTIVEDTRLVAMATDATSYTFDAPAGKAVTINVKLIYRRSFADLAKQKGWTDPDIIMAQETITVPGN